MEGYQIGCLIAIGLALVCFVLGFVFKRKAFYSFRLQYPFDRSRKEQIEKYLKDLKGLKEEGHFKTYLVAEGKQKEFFADRNFEHLFFIAAITFFILSIVIWSVN